ncbi:hypothetical protein [Mycolicibacterium fortuitum]|uniref:hypothetical protein n=1 Tax=Mycolicibacterium fortuitum TaxID=1766 RepID=UPI001CE16FF9|nr:hypothetical protein [Mycolicibacterium fortuitum]MCA4727386.1 hypothetical protein [Mycolicibacterium fortuitum]
MQFDEYPADLVRAVGLVVMSAAWTEDKAGELVQLTHMLENGHTDQAAKGWAASGQQLVEALGKVVAADLIDRLSQALELRNNVVHGVFLGGGGEPPSWGAMKRRLGRQDPAGYTMTGMWTVAALLDLAQEFTDLENLIDDEISYAMGLKERPAQA